MKDKSPNDSGEPDENPMPLPPDSNPHPQAPVREPDQPPPIVDPSTPEPTRLQTGVPIVAPIAHS